MKKKPTYQELEKEIQFLREEVKIKESKNEFASFFASNKAIMLQIDIETKQIINANKTAIDFYAYSKSELLKKTINDLNLLPLSEINKLMQKSIKAKSNFFQFQHKLANDEIRDVEVYASPVQFYDKICMIVTIYDVTDRKKIEYNLNEKQQLLKEAQHISQLGHWKLDLLNNKLSWSDEIYRIFDLKPQEFAATYEAFLENIHPEDRDRVNEAYSNSLKTQRPYEIEHRLLLKTGDLKYVIEKCSTEFDVNGHPIRSIGTIQDITERKKNEQKIQKQNKELQASKEELESVNAELLALSDSLIETNKKLFEVKEKAEASADRFEKLFKNNPVSLWEEDFSEIQETLNNIRKRNLPNYKEYLLDRPELVTRCSEKLKILNVNKATLELLNAPSEEYFYKNMDKILSKKSFDFFVDELNAILLNKKVFSGENELIGFDGKKRILFSKMFFVENTGIITAVIDITNRKSFELEIQTRNEQLKELNATKDKFFSIIAHDLKSPFNSMLGFSELLINNFDQYDVSQQKEFLGIIQDSIQSTYKLLENLLLWSRSQRGTIDFKPEKENLFLLVEETILVLNQTITNKSITLKNTIFKNIYVIADANMLSTIFRNLISNALKFTYKGGNIIIDAHIVDDEDPKKIEISVSDSGVGISEEKQTLLFGISENITTQGTEREEGTGLGLILCKEFVEKHGGKIWIESKVDKGSKFSFTLPLAL